MGRRRTQRGVALIVVLFLTAILMLLVLDFAHSMQVYAMIGGNARYDVQLRGGLHAGLAVAQRLVLDDLKTDVENDSAVDTLDEAWAGDIPERTLDGVLVTVTLHDEAGKFPLSTLVTYTFEEDGTISASTVDATRRQQLEILFDEMDIERELVDVLIDWLDTDDDAEPHGAENAAYAGSGRRCRNGPLTSIYELALLQGFTRTIVWGDPDDKDALGLADVCTVHARADGLVNANTAPEPVLRAVLREDDLARRVSRERDRDPFVDRADLNDRVGDSGVSTYLTTESGVWSADVTARTQHDVRPLTMSARAVLRRHRELDTGENTDPAQANQGTLFGGGPGAEGAAQGGSEAGVVRVVAWREMR